MREKTVEFQQVHDIDKIVRRCCAKTEEGLKRPKRMNPWPTRTAEARQSRGRSGGQSQSVRVTWNRSLIFLLMVLQRLLLEHRQLKTLWKAMIQEVKVPVAELH